MKLIWLLLPVLLSFLLSLKLGFASKSETKASKFLGFFFFLFFILLATFMLVDRFAEIEAIASLVNLSSLLFYVAIISLPPCVYLYVHFLTITSRSTEKNINVAAHFYLPIGLLLVNLISFFYFQITPDEKSGPYTYQLIEQVMTYSNFIALIFLFPILNIYYLYQSFVRYKKHKTTVNDFFSYNKGVSLKWIRTFLVGYALFIGYTYFIEVSSLSSPLSTNLLVLLYLGFIGFKGDGQFAIVMEDEVIAATPIDTDPINAVSQSVEKKKAMTVMIDDETKKYEAIKESLLAYMDQEKPFLDSQLNIHKLSKSLNTNNKYLSNVINNLFQQNFMTFINSYRIETSKEMLTNETYQNYTIEAIAKEAGFHSKSAFNNAFKNVTGLTPSRFKKNRRHSTGERRMA